MADQTKKVRDEMLDGLSMFSGELTVGIECNSGDTVTDGTICIAMTSMHVPDPGISLTVTPKDNGAQTNMSSHVPDRVGFSTTLRSAIQGDADLLAVSMLRRCRESVSCSE